MGSPVSLCPSCAHALPDGARFCGRCGHSLGDATAAPEAPAERTRDLARTVLQQGVKSSIVADLETTRDDPSAGARALEMGQPESRQGGAPPQAFPAGAAPFAAGWAKVDPTSPLSRSVAVAHSGAPPPTQLSHHSAGELASAPSAASADTALPGRGALPPLHATTLGLRPAIPDGPPPAAEKPPPVAPAGEGAGDAASSVAAKLPPLQRTMIGVALPGIAPDAPAPAAASAGPGERAATMIGVALPGIAPRAPGEPPADGPRGAVAVPSHHRTVMGGIAAIERPSPRPASPPLAHREPEPLPPMPTLLRQPKKGAPVVWVAAGLLAIVAAAGVGVALFVRGGEPLAAHPELAADGREIVALRCETCPDGTVLRVGDVAVTVQGKRAELVAPRPLVVGENRFEIAIDRPGLRRDETVTVDVPVRYRVRTDPAALVAQPPSLTVSVEAATGSTVTVDGSAVELDGQGIGRHVIPLASEATGATREPKLIERRIAYEVTLPDGTKEAGALAVKLHVLPLIVDAPLSVTTVQQERYTVAGQTRPGARVTVNGAVAPVGADGLFRSDVVLPSAGVYPIHVFAAADGLVGRTVEGRITRVASVAALLRDLEKRAVGFDGFAEGTAPEGKLALVDGEVVEGRLRQGQTLLIVSTRPGCGPRGTCLARIVYGAENSVPRGAHVRAVGPTRGVVEASGKRIPEVEAQVLTMQGQP